MMHRSTNGIRSTNNTVNIARDESSAAAGSRADVLNNQRLHQWGPFIWLGTHHRII